MGGQRSQTYDKTGLAMSRRNCVKEFSAIPKQFHGSMPDAHRSTCEPDRAP